MSAERLQRRTASPIRSPAPSRTSSRCSDGVRCGWVRGGAARTGCEGTAVHEIGVFAVLVMEITLILPWFRSLTAHTQALTTLGALALLLGAAVLAMALVRAGQSVGRAEGIRRAILLGGLAVYVTVAIRVVVYRGVPVGVLQLIIDSFRSFESVLTLVPSELVVVLAVLYAWRRGVVVASKDVLDAGWTAHRMRVGILAHIVFGLIFRSSGGARLLEILPLYFGAGLTGVATSRADGLVLRGAGKSPFAWEWLTGILGVVVGTVGLGLGVAGALASPPATRIAAWIGERALDGVEILLQLAKPLILGIAVILERLIDWLIDVTAFQPTLIRLQEGLPRAPTPTPEPSAPASWLDPYAAPLQIIGTTMLVVFLALIAVRLSRRLARPPLSLGDDRAEALSAPPPRLPPLRGILAKAKTALEQARHLGRRSLAAAAVRRIYARLLALAEARGRARAAAETPREFMPQLWALFPNHRHEVEIITEEYLRIRYGEYPEAEEAVARVRAAWSAVLEEARGGVVR